MRNTGKMPCPICDAPTHVYDTHRQGNEISRRRQCDNGHRFNTREMPVAVVHSQFHRGVEPSNADDYDEQEATLKQLLG